MTPEELQKQRHDKLERDLAAFLAILAGMLPRWRAEINTLVEHAERMNPLTALQYLQQQLPVELDALGYSHLVDDVLSGYDEAEEFAYRMAETLKIPAHELNQADPQDVLAIKRIDRNRLMSGRDAAVAAIAAAIIGGYALDTPASDTHEAIQQSIDGLNTRFSRDAETGLFTFDRYVTVTMFKDKAEKFFFFNPIDGHTRRWCLEHANQAYTYDELLAMRNASNPPYDKVIPWLGGIGCRGTLFPLPE